MFKLKHLIFLAVVCVFVGGVSLAKGATCSAVDSSNGCGAGPCDDDELCKGNFVGASFTCVSNADCVQNPGDQTVGTPVNPYSTTPPKTGSCISCSSVGSSCSYYSEAGVCNNTYGTYCNAGEPYNCVKPCCVKKGGVYDNETRKEAIKPKSKITDLMYNGPRITNILQLITPVAKALYFGGIFIGFCFIVYSGYALMTSEGNPQKTQDAQGQLTSAILGIMFILLSAAILRVIINSLIGGNISI